MRQAVGCRPCTLPQVIHGVEALEGQARAECDRSAPLLEYY